MKTRVLLVVLLLSAPLTAQDNGAAWPLDQRHLADAVSTWLVGAQLGLDTLHSFKSPDRPHAFGCQAFRTGITFGAAEGMKLIVHRWRPDESDRKSFYSEHSAFAGVASGWKFQIPIAVGVGYLRIAANKHWPSDVAAGLAASYLARKVCHS